MDWPVEAGPVGAAPAMARPRAIQAIRSAPLEAGETACMPVRLLIKSFNSQLKPL
jgi:hypothetical protein